MVEKKTVILHMLFPLLLGGMLYYLLAPNVIFVRRIDEILHISRGYALPMTDSVFIRFFRNYFLDMAWGYALVFALFCCTGRDARELKKIFIMAVILSILLEGLQMTSIVQGTFDVWDIGVEFLAEGIALLMIKFLNKGKETYHEKKK